MNIVVCIKQVPDVNDIKWTKENNLDRINMLSKINPHDEWALDCAINIKNKINDTQVTAISMGPDKAGEVLNLALAKGADRAILLSDKAFSGSDTLATAKILSCAIKKYIENPTLILTGHLAVDGDTAQVPVSMAQLLGVIDVVSIDEIINVDKNMAIVSQRFKNEVNIIEVKHPSLLAINAPAKNKIIPKIEDYVRAQNRGIEVYNLEDLGLNKTQVGIIGSPTMVWRAFRPEINKKTEEIKENYADKLMEFLLRAR